MYYSQKIESNKDNNNSLWHIVKDLVGSKITNTSNTFINEGKEVKDPKEIANMFNSYFVNIGPNLASEINVDQNQGNFSQFLHEPFDKSLFLRPTNSNEIVKIVQSLKTSKSTGYDGISVNLLKKNHITLLVTHIFNLSITSGVCPNS